MTLQPHQRALLWAGAATIPFWIVAELKLLLLPLVLLNTHIHEFCHALAGMATGGGAKIIMVNADTSGVTHVYGGMALIVAPAGYVGTAVVGGLMIALSGSEKGAKRMLWTLFAFLAFTMVAFVRGDLIGILSGFMWAIITAVLARSLKKEHAIVAAQFLGLQLCLSSFFSFLTLWQISAGSQEHTDAQIMAQASGIPAIVWATAWMLFAAAVVFFALRASWKGQFKS